LALFSGLTDIREKHVRGARRVAIAIAVAATACLVLASTALAGPDPLNGGKIQFDVQKLRGLKTSAKNLGLKITGGAVDPIDGSGTVQVGGGLRALRSGNRSNVSFTTLILRGEDATGTIIAKVGRKKVRGFGFLKGGTVTRDRWGARIEGIHATLGRKGAIALTNALIPDESNAAIKAGQSLGTITITTLPRTVEVVPGSGSMTLTVPLTFGLQLDAHCVDALSGGVAAVAPATKSGLTSFTFPVSGGSLSPTFVDGKIQTSGGQTITKNNGGVIPILYPGCGSAAPPAGTSILQNDFAPDFGIRSLTAHAFPPGVDLGVAALGSFDTAGAVMTVNPATKQVSISNLGIDLAPIAADLLNNLFPSQGGSGNDFKSGERLGAISVTAKLR
jgi:hypothetical protein